MKFGRLLVSPAESGYEFRVYGGDGEDATYRATAVPEAEAWRLVEYIMDVQRARKLEHADSEEPA